MRAIPGSKIVDVVGGKRILNLGGMDGIKESDLSPCASELRMPDLNMPKCARSTSVQSISIVRNSSTAMVTGEKLPKGCLFKSIGCVSRAVRFSIC
jgi:hypothetical protein